MTQLVADPDRALVLAYAPADRRAALAAMFRLDEALGQVVRGARDPMLGQMRLTWWHEALSGLGRGTVSPDPVLADLLTSGVVPGVTTGPALAAMIEGWEALLDESVDFTQFAQMRGGVLFRIGGAVLEDYGAPLEAAGAGWALVDLARHSSTPGAAVQAMDAAMPYLRAAMASSWPRRLRALGALAALAARDAGRGVHRLEPAGHPARMVRALRHRLTGR